MKKYLAWAESEETSELWFLVDATSKEQAEKLVMEEDEVIELRACLEVKPNEEVGVSHRFSLNE